MTIPEAARHAVLGKNVRIDAADCSMGAEVCIGDNVTIEAERLVLGDYARVGSDVVIRADDFEMGFRSRIEDRCLVATMTGGPAKHVRIGDCSVLAHDCKLLVPAAAIGDYTAVHNHSLLNGRKPLLIGHNCWIGQHCMINAEDDLTIGNHVGIGAYSSVYTHGFFGDLLEGSQVFKIAPVEIGDDAWILGSYNVISPGVVIGEKALVLTGSNVTKNVGANRTVGGAPARDLTERLTPYREVSLDDKLEKMREFVQQWLVATFSGSFSTDDEGIRVVAEPAPFRILFCAELTADTRLPAERPLIVIAKTVRPGTAVGDVTVIDLGARSYHKTLSDPEVRLIGFLKSYRARFVPADQPRVQVPSEVRDGAAC